MTGHVCATGHHTWPSPWCYESHGCRCDRCRQLKNTANTRSRRANGPDRTRANVPRQAWETITTATTDRGYTTDQLIEDIARQMSK